MRLGEQENARKAMVLSVMAACTAGTLIMLSTLVATALWPGLTSLF